MSAFEQSMDTLLVKVYRDLDVLEEQMLNASRLNLSISEVHMLEAVENAAVGGSATISALSEHLAISLPSVTLAVNKLERKGYVSKNRHPSDGRVVQVQLTRAGQRAERAHRYFHRSMVRDIARQMSEEEKQALIRGVTKLDAFLQKNIEKYTKQNETET